MQAAGPNYSSKLSSPGQDDFNHVAGHILAGLLPPSAIFSRFAFQHGHRVMCLAALRHQKTHSIEW